jgi:hypothetical protein
MTRIYFALLTLVSITAFGRTPDEARFVNHWVAQCSAPFGAYQLSFDSPSGDATNDDMTVSIKVGTGASAPVSLKPSLFVTGRLASNSTGQCDNVSTVSFPSGDILLFIQRDDRPSPDRVSAVLLRAKDGAVLDSVADLGAQDNSTSFSEHAGQVRIKLIRSWRNTKSKTAEPVPVAGWLALSEVDGKIKYVWK